VRRKEAGALGNVLPARPAQLPVANSQEPLMLECRGSFMVLDLDGLHAFGDETPRGPQTVPAPD
jgi:hypothetical protein